MTIDNNIKATTFIFPHEILTPIVGKPTHATIALLKKQVYANANRNSTVLGGRKLGYLGLIVSPTSYKALQVRLHLPEVAFNVPQEPAVATDDDAMRITNRVIYQQIADCNAMEFSLRQQLLTAIESKYLRKLADKNDFGFARVTCNQIITYLTNTYGKITAAELLANNEKLQAPFDFNTNPIIDLWIRIDECQRFARDGEAPLHDKMILVTVLKVLQDSGMFQPYIMYWNRTNDSSSAQLADFIDYFTQCDTERRLQTARGAGYHNTNNASSSGKPTTAPKATDSISTDPAYFVCNGKKVYYCHSHGGSLNPEHTSAKCTNPKKNHVCHATWENTCNGNMSMHWSSRNRQPRNRNHGNGNNNF